MLDYWTVDGWYKHVQTIPSHDWLMRKSCNHETSEATARWRWEMTLLLDMSMKDPRIKEIPSLIHYNVVFFMFVLC